MRLKIISSGTLSNFWLSPNELQISGEESELHSTNNSTLCDEISSKVSWQLNINPNTFWKCINTVDAGDNKHENKG